MKKLLLILSIILLCIGSYPVFAQEAVRLDIAPCWYGDTYSVDCTFRVNGTVSQVTAALPDVYMDWNYIAEENLLLVGIASSGLLPDPAGTGAFLAVMADPGTTLTLEELLINGKPAAIGQTVRGTVTSYGNASAPVTLRLLQNGDTVHLLQAEGNTASYSFPSVLPGNYILQVSKANHVTREYSVIVADESAP